MIKEFIKKNVMVSAIALALMIIGSNAKADFFRWYIADDVAHNGDFRTLCFQINAYDQVLNAGNPVTDFNCGMQPGDFRMDLADYRLVRDVFGIERCYAYNSIGAMLNRGGFVEERFCFENARREREFHMNEWRVIAERERIVRMHEHDRLERERLAREERQRFERERLQRERLERERRERDNASHRRDERREEHGRYRSSNDDAGVEDTGGIKSVAPGIQDLAPGSQDKLTKELAG